MLCSTLLDIQNRLSDFEVLFAGTLTQTSLFPSVVFKPVLARSAAAVLLRPQPPVRLRGAFPRR